MCICTLVSVNILIKLRRPHIEGMERVSRQKIRYMHISSLIVSQGTFLFQSVAPISQSMTIFSAIPLIPGLEKVLGSVLLFIGRK